MWDSYCYTKIMTKITNWFHALKKAVEWRAISVVIDFVVAFMFTGELKLSLGIASLSGFVKFCTNIIWIRKRFS